MMTAQRRHIVLREFPPHLNRTVRPSPEYLETTDGSLRDEDYLVRTDADGYLETGNANRGKVPIYILGDSFTEAVFEHQGKRFSDIFERNLIERNLDYLVINASYSRATLLHLFNLLINKILSAKPVNGTTVVLFKPQIDVRVVNAPGSYWNEFGMYAPISPARLDTDEITNDLDQDIESGERLLHIIAESCDRFGIRLVFGTSPARGSDRQTDPVLFKYFESDDERSTRAAHRDSSNALIRRVAQQRDITLVDADRSFAGDKSLLYDYTHMNSAGQQHLADLLTDVLADKL
jgi:lysophospholipase L1-like esterase